MPGPIAVILAGGANRRFWPLTQKSLLSFGGRTLLDVRLAELAAGGFADAIVVANPANEPRMQEIAAATAAPRTAVVVQPEPLGMGDAVLRCAGLLDGDRPALVNQVHDLVDPALFGRLAEHMRMKKADGHVVGVKLTSYFPGGYLSVDGDRATGVVEKPPPGTEPSDLMKIVADAVTRPRDLLDALGAVDRNPADHYERAWARLMERSDVRVLGYDGPWVAIKYPWDVLRAAEHHLSQTTVASRGSDCFVHEHATVSGPVVLGARVRVFAGAAIAGPAIVGDDTIVGNGALIRGSIVGRNCVVGFGAEVARSYLGDGCELHTNYVGDSVLGDDVSLGSGSVTANLRLDEANVRVDVDGQRLDTGRPKLGAMIGSHVRVGINASFGRPGLRIGSNSAVGPGVLLMRDLPDGKMVTVQQDHDIADLSFEIDRASRDRFHKNL